MDTSTGTAADARAGRREWLGLGVLALPTLLLALDLSVLYLALPQLSVDLHASGVQQLWITDIFGFMVAGFLVTMGGLGDRIGRRRLLMIGAAVFGVGSILAAFSVSAPMLIATRAMMGIAASTIAPSALALISGMFADARQRSVAMATWMSCFVGGNAVGPLIGGLLLAHFWWGSVFLLGVPVMLLLLVTGPVLLLEYRAPKAGSLELASVGLSLAALLPTIYGLKQLARNGFASVPVVAVVVGIGFGVLFVRRQRRLAEPLLDLGLFKLPTLRWALTMMFVGGIFLGGTTLLVTQFLQLVQGLSPLRAGLWLLPAIAAMIVGSMSAPHIARRVRPGFVMGTGMAIAAAGYVVLTQVHSIGGLPVLVVGWAVALGGNGLPAGLNVDLVVGSAPPRKAGSASAITQTSMELGLALGIAIVGSIGTAVYRARMADVPVPAGTPAGVAQAARDAMTGALSVARQAPELLAPARAAYTAGLNVAVGSAAVVFGLLAALAFVTLRAVPRYGQRDQVGDDTQGAESATENASASR